MLGAILILCLNFILWLLRDPDYGTWNKRAFQLIQNRLGDKWSVGFLDMDDLHVCNDKYGYENVNQKIRNALTMRTQKMARTDIMFRYFSGDEIVFVVRDKDARGTAMRILKSLKAQGLSCTMVVGKVSQLDEIKSKIQQMKRDNQRGEIYFLGT